MNYDANYYAEHYERLLDHGPYFDIRALYWKKAITEVINIPEHSLILDYGCGTGQVSMAFTNTHYFDIAEFSRDLIKKRGRLFYDRSESIPLRTFDFILSSHALEHSPRPYEDLLMFRRFAKPDGRLLLILPVETVLYKTLKTDTNNHLYCWTFQAITNLLLSTGWEPLTQTYVYDSFGLGVLSRMFPDESAVSLAWCLGKIRRKYKSMMVVAQNKNV